MSDAISGAGAGASAPDERAPHEPAPGERAPSHPSAEQQTRTGAGAGRTSSNAGASPASGRTSRPGGDADIAVYVISVAAELAGMHPQTLRQYDRLGLVSPGRSAGRGRRYSPRDIAVLREVQRLSHEEGVNLAGIKRVLELEAEVDNLRDQVLELARQLDRARDDAARNSADVAMSYQRRYLPVPVTTTSGALVIWSAGKREA